MPSLRVLLKGLALSTLVTSTVAAPVERQAENACALAAVVDSPALALIAPTIPASGAVPDLNGTALTLQYVVIGRGIQNYTCSTIGKAGTAIGAIATLYDATTVAYSDETLLHTLPPISVNLPVAQAGKFRTAAQVLDLPVLGHHFFDINGTPVFDLSAASKILYAAKIESVAAPANANKGPSGTGAVQWLKLSDKKGYAFGTSVGLGEVYRVETAGGVSPLCTEASGVISVQYATEYWFYA